MGLLNDMILDIKATVIFTNRYYIRRVSLEEEEEEGARGEAGGAHSTLITHNLTNAVALDMDWARGCLYWSDVTRVGSAIRRACAPRLLAPHRAPLQAPPPIPSDDYQVPGPPLIFRSSRNSDRPAIVTPTRFRFSCCIAPLSRTPTA